MGFIKTVVLNLFLSGPPLEDEKSPDPPQPQQHYNDGAIITFIERNINILRILFAFL